MISTVGDSGGSTVICTLSDAVWFLLSVTVTVTLYMPGIGFANSKAFSLPLMSIPLMAL